MPNIDEKTLENEVRALIAEIVEIEPEKITQEANFVEDLAMDSMMALEILAALEKKYKIRIPEDKLMRLRNLREAINLAKESIDAS